MTATTSFVITIQIVPRRDEFFIEAKFQDGALYQECGPFDDLEEAKRAYADMMKMISEIPGAAILTTH